jgi:hypothetical protein
LYDMRTQGEDIAFGFSFGRRAVKPANADLCALGA